MVRFRTRSALLLGAVLAAGVLSGCCGKICQKDPPCRPCENPCCLTPIQKASLKVNTHALNDGPRVYSYDNRVYVLFSEKGETDFTKDPTGYREKGALRLIKAGKTVYVDVNPGDDYEWQPTVAQAVPYSAPPPPAK